MKGKALVHAEVEDHAQKGKVRVLHAEEYHSQSHWSSRRPWYSSAEGEEAHNQCSGNPLQLQEEEANIL